MINTRRVLTAAGVAAALLMAAVAWFLFGDAPEAVDLGRAAAELEEVTPTGDAGTDGVWTVSTDVEPYSLADSTGTFVGFRITEELQGIGATEAVGRTPTVSGTVELDGGTLTAARIEADLTALRTDRSQRDGRVQDALETSLHPTAVFRLAEPVVLGDAAEGDALRVTARGTLTVRGVSRVVDLPLDAVVSDGVAVVTGSLEVALADYGVAVPRAPVVLSASDRATVELQLYLVR